MVEENTRRILRSLTNLQPVVVPAGQAWNVPAVLAYICAGVVVVPSYLSKGIEFDAVIIYDASEKVYGEESLRRTFYTACTRAMHSLQLYSVGEPSPFLQKAVQEGLIKK